MIYAEWVFKDSYILMKIVSVIMYLSDEEK